MFTTQTHTHTPSHATHTERDLQSRFGKEKLIKRFKLQQKVWKTPKDTHRSIFRILRNTPLGENRRYFINWLISNSMNYSKWNFQFNVKACSDLRKAF